MVRHAYDESDILFIIWHTLFIKYIKYQLPKITDSNYTHDKCSSITQACYTLVKGHAFTSENISECKGNMRTW